MQELPDAPEPGTVNVQDRFGCEVVATARLGGQTRAPADPRPVPAGPRDRRAAAHRDLVERPRIELESNEGIVVKSVEQGLVQRDLGGIGCGTHRITLSPGTAHAARGLTA